MTELEVLTETGFFQDLAVIMTIAGVVAALFSRLGWPKVIGYIVAGVLMNRYTWGGSFLQFPQSVSIIGQLGVVLLMLGMGLGFSARELKKIRRVVMPTAVVDTVVMIWLGYIIGVRVFGWSAVASMFLGVAICDSATTLLAKVIDEMGWSGRQFAHHVLGTSVCEDIICVGAIAVATGFANGGTMSVGALLSSLGWLSVFLLSTVVIGLVLVPRFLNSVAKRRDDEALLLAMMGTTFFISYVALKQEFSLAIGAFIVGFLCSTTSVRDRIVGLVDPLKSMFSAIFFVSIGLLVDPAALLQHAGMILLLTVVVMVGKCVNVTVVSLLTGVEVKPAVQNGMGLAQIGEFAFMVAVLYVATCPDASEPLFPIAVGTSLLTTLLNPLMIRLSDRVGDFAERHQPVRVRAAFETYRGWLEKLTMSGGSQAFMLLKSAVLRLGVVSVLMFTIATVCAFLPSIDYSRYSNFFEKYDAVIFFILSNVLTLALVPLVISPAQRVGDEVSEILFGGSRFVWQKPIQQFARYVAYAVVGAFFLAEWTMINISHAPRVAALPWITLGVVVVVGIVGWRFLAKTGRRALTRFNEALTAEERRESLRESVAVAMPEGQISRMVLEDASPAVGLSVVQLNIRAKTGVTIVAVVRGGRVVRNIGPSWEFAGGDLVVATGDQQQIAALKDLLGITS